MTRETDPVLEPLYVKGRAQNALILSLGILLVPFVLTLVFGENGYVGGRKFAYGIGAVILLIPVLSLKSWATENRAAGVAICTVTAAVGCFVGTGMIWLALVASVSGFAAAYAFYHVKNNTDYRPNLMPAAIEKARAEAAAQAQ